MIRFGLVKTSLIDYPGEVAAVLFTRGCNLRCPYCHNPELVTGPESEGMLSPEEVMAFLRRRNKVLGGVCVSGGEPLLHPEIPELVREIRRLGLKVKVDTNGILPEALGKIEADYVAMDIKTSPEKYPLLLPDRDAAEAVRESIRYLIRSGRDYEFRTTAAPGIVEMGDIEKIAALVQGAKRYVLAQYRPAPTLDKTYGESTAPYPEEVLRNMQATVEGMGIPCRLRLHS